MDSINFIWVRTVFFNYLSKHRLIILTEELLILFVRDYVKVLAHKASIIFLLPLLYLFRGLNLRRRHISVLGDDLSHSLAAHLLRRHRTLKTYLINNLKWCID
jgi:hypothetical protein